MNKKKTRRQRMMPLIPSLMTTGNLFFGLLSIMTSIQIVNMSLNELISVEVLYRKYWWAAAFIGISAKNSIGDAITPAAIGLGIPVNLYFSTP